MRAFNTMGTCDPLKHYLVDLTDKVHKIKELVDDGKYFSISKARRYGKTTTLSALKKALSKDSPCCASVSRGSAANASRPEGPS